MSPIRRMWHGTKWGRLLIIGPYIAVVLTASGVTWRLHDNQIHSCHQRRDDRTVLRALVTQAYTSNSGQLDLTRIAGFDDLDPATKSYLANLSHAISTGGDSNAKKAALDLIPPITC